MASTIVFRRGNTFPSQGSGITLAEPVFNTSQNTFHIGLGHGVTAEWVGAPITGLSASIASAEAYKIPTAAAVKNYIGGLCFGNTGAPTITQYVSSFNGQTGAVQGVSAAVAGTGISVSGATGAVTITNTGVQSFNGLTGAVGGVTTSVANTFTALQTFTTGISAAGGVTLSATLYVGTTAQVGSLDVRSGAATRYMSFVPGSVNQIIARGPSSLNIFHESFNPVRIGDYDAGNNATYIEVDDSNQVIKFYYNGDSYTFPTASGSVGQVLGTTSAGSLSWVDSVRSFNGSTGPVGISAGTGISITQSGKTFTIASSGGGGSKTYERFTPLDNQPPASNFATIDTRNSIMVLDFADSSADESAIFVGVIPEAASLGSGLKVRIIWMATSATSGNVRWGVQFMNLNTDLDSDSFDTATEGNGTANGTNGTPTTTELTVTNIDSLTAGDFFRLKIYREQSDTVNDTMTGDAELIAVEVRSAS